MVHEEIKSGYNKVLIYGNSERITIEQVRGSTTEFRTVINRHPGILERIFPACYDEGLFLFNPTEERFRNRIKKAIKIALDFSKEKDKIDADNEARLIKEIKDEAQQKMEIDQFIASMKDGVRP